MQHRDRIILYKILEEIKVGQEIIKNIAEKDFLENEIVKRASTMTIINIGELVKSLTDDFRRENSHIPWKDIAGMRDLAAHKYKKLKMEDVYMTIDVDFPALKNEIKKLL